MNKIITGVCVIVVCCFCACDDQEQDQEPNLTNTDPSKSVIKTPDSQKLGNPGTTVPASGQVMTPPLPPPVFNQSPSTTTAPGMNPAHGQPNHRCDIAVGAPLNSPVANPVNQTASKTSIPVVPPTATPVQQATIQTETPAGMNPPHGKAGHRCDIAVGAPLNSPVTKPSTPTITPTPVIVPEKKGSGS
jgi:hypothetical protein